MTTRVRSVIAAAIAGRSWRASSVSGTWTGVAPATTASHGYASNERQAKMTSSPGPEVASTSCARIDTLPAATCTESSSTPKRSARRWRSRAGGRIGVAIELGRGVDGFEHAGQRVEGVLVARELERVAPGLLALLVGRQRGDLGADPHGDRGGVGHPDEFRD